MGTPGKTRRFFCMELLKIPCMEELINRLKSEGLSNEQAETVISTIRNYVVEKYPMLEGAVNNIFGEE